MDHLVLERPIFAIVGELIKYHDKVPSAFILLLALVIKTKSLKLCILSYVDECFGFFNGLGVSSLCNRHVLLLWRRGWLPLVP